MPEAAPGKFVGCLQTAHTHKLALFVDLGGLAIQHTGQFILTGNGIHYCLQGICRTEGITSIEKTEIVACRKGNTLVHGIVQSLIGLAHNMCELNAAGFRLCNGIVL